MEGLAWLPHPSPWLRSIMSCADLTKLMGMLGSGCYTMIAKELIKPVWLGKQHSLLRWGDLPEGQSKIN